MIAKLGVVEQELDEAMLWMELFIESGVAKGELLAEAEGILKITIASIRKTKNRQST